MAALGGCTKDYGPGVLLTVHAPANVYSTAPELKLFMHGGNSGPVNDDTLKKPGGAFFNGTTSEVVLVQAAGRSGTINVRVGATFAEGDAWSSDLPILIAATTVRSEVQLMMNTQPPDRDMYMPSDMAADLSEAIPDLAGAPDGADLLVTPCTAIGMCMHNNGKGQFWGPANDALRSIEAAEWACYKYRDANTETSAVCEAISCGTVDCWHWYPELNPLDQIRWCVGGKIYGYQGGCVERMGSAWW